MVPGHATICGNRTTALDLDAIPASREGVAALAVRVADITDRPSRAEPSMISGFDIRLSKTSISLFQTPPKLAGGPASARHYHQETNAKQDGGDRQVPIRKITIS